MKKVIKRQAGVCVDVRDGLNRVKEEFYSHDKNNAYIELKLNSLNAEKVIVLFKFKTTNRLLEVAGTVENNLVSIPFDTSLITTDEIVDGFVYAEKVVQSADILKFSFGVRVSEIDKHSELPVIEKETKRIVAVTDIVTLAELEEAVKKIHVEGSTYDDSNIRTEISRILSDIEGLKTKTDKDTVYDDSALKQRLTALESKPEKDTSNLVTRQELENKNYLTAHQDISRLATKEELNNLVTKQELRDKNYLTSHQSLSDYALKSEIPTPYNDLELKKRVERLESKPDLDTSNFVTNEVLNSKGYLTHHQSLEGYAKKSEIPQAYNDTEVKQRLSTIEQKGESYATKEQLASVPKNPQKLTLSGNTLILSDGGGSVNLPTQQATNTPAGQVNQYEIHGTGMPNRKVTAPVGTTYVDTAVTNGALKWIKRTGNGNEGWEVLTGDTGWRTLNIQSKLGNSFLKVRRKNDTVMYQFGGLSWGWFGVVRRGGQGYSPQGSDKERNCYILGLSGVPYGFRSESSLIGGIYNDKGTPYGTWYLGGYGDSNMLRFQFTDPVPTDRDIGDIRVSSISYLTSEPWPNVLP
nr:MAG TPA: GENERAL CONTROL PROTEIN GCN4, NOR1 BINDING PROTEIN, ALPHA/BETA COILED.6A [Caudoviricetes sp.]